MVFGRGHVHHRGRSGLPIGNPIANREHASDKLARVLFTIAFLSTAELTQTHTPDSLTSTSTHFPLRAPRQSTRGRSIGDDQVVPLQHDVREAFPTPSRGVLVPWDFVASSGVAQVQ